MLLVTGPEPSSTMKNPPEGGRLTNSSSPARKPLANFTVALAIPTCGEGGVASGSPAMRPDDSTDPGEPGEYDAVGDTLSRNGGSFTCVMSTVTLPVPIPSPPLPWEPVLPSFNV